MSDEQTKKIEAGGEEPLCTRCEKNEATYVVDEDHALCEGCQETLEAQSEMV